MMTKDNRDKNIVVCVVSFLVFVLVFLVNLDLNHSFVDLLHQFDRFVIEFFQSKQTNALTNFYRDFTTFGSYSFYITIVTLGYVFIKNKKQFLKLSIILTTLSMLVTYFLKSIIARQRPETDNWLTHVGDLSFPSGHSLHVTSFCFGFYLFYLNNKKTVKFSWLHIAVLSLLIFLVGTSRIYLGVHYPTDIIAGVSLGIIISILTNIIFDRFFREVPSA